MTARTGARRLGCLSVLVAALVLSGCASTNVFLHPEADMTFYTSVGIVPFRNLSATPFAGEKASAVFAVELMAAELFNVLESGQFLNIAAKVAGDELKGNQDFSVEQLRRMGNDAGVQAIFLGTITAYEMVRIGSEQFPLISIEARLVDTETGTIVWSASSSRKGGPTLPIIGVGEVRTLAELNRKVNATLVSKLPH